MLLLLKTLPHIKVKTRQWAQITIHALKLE